VFLKAPVGFAKTPQRILDTLLGLLAQSSRKLNLREACAETDIGRRVDKFKLVSR